MSNEISGAASEINRLHAEICQAARATIEKAIRIGELLTEQKAGLKHGEWLPWLKANTCWLMAPARSLSPVTTTPPEPICTTASKRFAGAISMSLLVPLLEFNLVRSVGGIPDRDRGCFGTMILD